MKTLIRTIVILGAVYSSASQANEVDKHQQNLIASFEAAVETVKRASAAAKEEFHLVSDRFKADDRFVGNLSSELTISDVLIPGPPKEGTIYRTDMFAEQVRTRNVELATQDIILCVNIMRSLNGILLTEASLDPSREKEL
jgi:hypothetical protein